MNIILQSVLILLFHHFVQEIKAQPFSTSNPIDIDYSTKYGFTPQLPYHQSYGFTDLSEYLCHQNNEANEIQIISSNLCKSNSNNLSQERHINSNKSKANTFRENESYIESSGKFEQGSSINTDNQS